MSQQDSSTREQIFSTRLKSLRLRKALTQEALAEELGVSKGSVGNWEGSNPIIPHPGTLRKIAQFFECSVDYLLGEESGVYEVEPPRRSVYLAQDEGSGREQSGSGEVPTKEMCRRYLESFLETCSDPGKIAWTYYELQEHFPLNKWKKGKT